MKEFDVRLETDAIERAQQIRGEHERAFQDRDDQQVFGLGGGYLPGQLGGSLRYRLFIE
jgi:hypothetical protein